MILTYKENFSLNTGSFCLTILVFSLVSLDGSGSKYSCVVCVGVCVCVWIV